MTCWRCGATIEEEHIKCPTCGASRPKARRQQAVNEAAAQYHASMQGVEEANYSLSREGSRSASQRPRGGNAKRKRARRSGSMPPSSGQPVLVHASGVDGEPIRMVRRHQYEAIQPKSQGYDQVNWLRLCLIALLCVVVLVLGVYIFLSRTDPGQRWLASSGYEASVEAYHDVGRMYMVEGSISRAIWALEIAQVKEPDNLEILIDLGKAYMGNNDIQHAELAYAQAIELYPAYPEPYRLLLDNLLDRGMEYEGLQLVEMAIANTGDTDEHFTTMQARLLPHTPSVSILGNRFEKVINGLEIKSDESDVNIYYTLKGEDPKVEGTKYIRPFSLGEGNWRLRAVAEKDGLYSNEQSQNYIVNKPNPDMPKATLASGTYDKVRTVSLRSTDESVVAIYYTTDGTQPTTDSRRFTEPIMLRIGKTQLRAIAENAEGKLSNEMVVEYKCEGKTKESMSETDNVDKLKLYNTTRESFESTYGAPLEEVPDGEDLLGSYTKLIYPFGYAVFLDRGGDKPLVLMELSFSSTLSGPRGTGIGSRMENIIDSFRDEGGEENMKGGRLLYSLTSGRMGIMTKHGETEYTVSYYCMQENGQYVELTYHITGGLVDRIDWLQYDPA